MKDLQERLNAIADNKLDEFIRVTFMPLESLNIFGPAREIQISNVGNGTAADRVLFRLKKYVAESLRDVYRENETKAFMDKVASLSEQYDELQGVINAEFEVTT